MSTQQFDADSQAVVIGGSLAGLLAARVLSEHFTSVTVVDRDELPTEPVHRRGVPQSRHTHGLLAKGYAILEGLLPGFGADLIAAGAKACDLDNDVIWYNEGHALRRAPSTMAGLLVSRPTLEAYVRRRVAAIPGVTILAKTEALGLLDHGGRIAGASVVGPEGGLTLPASLVVDASGRSNRGPSWLADLGYSAVPEETVNAKLVYVTREYQRVDGAQDFAAVIIGHHPGNPRGTGTAASDGNRWMVTLLGVGDEVPPTAPGEFEEWAARLDGSEVRELVRTAQPLTDPVRFRIGPSVRRRYERCAVLPEGFIALGDALCCFNPAYGQGMTTAAMAASWLGTCLKRGRRNLTKRYFAGVKPIIDVPWDITVGADLRFPEVEGVRTGRIKFLNGYLSHLHRAAASDAVVGAAFLKVANFLAPPPSLMSPAILWRVWRAGRARKTVTPRVAPAGRPGAMAS
jgi:2-polyprenyl-6-methoxyphenol hydroxylase-like FAD-dependent oxidoreductase